MDVSLLPRGTEMVVVENGRDSHFRFHIAKACAEMGICEGDCHCSDCGDTVVALRGLTTSGRELLDDLKKTSEEEDANPRGQRVAKGYASSPSRFSSFRLGSCRDSRAT